MKKSQFFVVLLLLFAVVSSAPGQSQDAGHALRFFGNGVNDIDRVKIRIDDPATSDPGPPADVGATDFTLEFWMKGQASENPAAAISCGNNNNWIFGNMIVDRDRFNNNRDWGISIADGVVVFGVIGENFGDRLTIGCGGTNVLDNQWHHIAIQRKRSDGQMWVLVDGQIQHTAIGPSGDISYPDNAVPCQTCCDGGPCTNSDPYFVIGAEKHDAGAEFPPFSGVVDEIRLSTTLRYLTNFTRPSAPFITDANTVALYHFDEGQGDTITDVSGAIGGPSNGVRRFGGSPAGPVWLLSDAPLGNGVPVTLPTPPTDLTVTPP